MHEGRFTPEVAREESELERTLNLREQYDRERRSLIETGLVEELRPGEFGIIDLDGVERPMPTYESLRDTLEHKLLAMEGTRRNGHPTQRLYNNINITFPNVPADDLMMALKKDVAISSGSACSSADAAAGKISHVLRAIGINDETGRCTVRIGIGRFTTEEEIGYAGKKIVEAAERLQKTSPRHQIEKNSRHLTTHITTH